MTSTKRIRSSRRGIAAAVGPFLLLGLLLMAAAPAQAGGYKKLRFGVMDGAVDPQSDIARMGRANVATLRILFRWKNVEVQRGDPGRCNAIYDWTYTDQLVHEAGRRGVRLLPVLIGSPSYVDGTDANAPHTKSDSIGDWKCFVRAVGERYGRGGNYLFFDADARPITEWQIWNEPSIGHFAARGKVNPREYGRLVKISRRQLVKSDRKAGIVLGGIPERYRGGMNARPFLKKLYRVKRIKRVFDVVAVHLYARGAAGIKGGMLRMRRHLKRLGTGGRPLWLTETGWSTDGPEKSHPLVKSPKGQARQLRKTFRLLRRNNKRLKLGTVTWFRWRDAAVSGGGASHFDFAGLYDKGGKPKRSCSSFIKFTDGRKCRPIQDSGTATAGVDRPRSDASLLEAPGDERRTVASPPE